MSLSTQTHMTIVGCSVRDSNALALLKRVVSLERAEPRVLPSPLQSRHARSLDGCAAFVFDLAPWDRSAVEFMRWLRRQRPLLPILLYPPHVPGVTELVLECGAIYGVSAHSQLNTRTDMPVLRREVRNLLDCVAGLAFVELVRQVVREAPHEIVEFARIAVRTLQTERNVTSLNVEHLAMKLGLSTRTLHRSWEDTPLPHPKEMLDWLVLLFVSYQASRERLPHSRIADAIGLDRQRAYRIRKRLLADKPKVKPTNAAQAFDFVAIAFLERCGRPRSDAVDIKQRLFG